MRHLPVRPLVALFLSLCVWTVFTAPSHGQQTTATTLTFPASAWAALAHGKPAEAESLAARGRSTIRLPLPSRAHHGRTRPL